MKRGRNGAEIKSMRPDDVLFPLFPMQNSIPKINYSEEGGGERGLKREGREGGAGRMWPQL